MISNAVRPSNSRKECIHVYKDELVLWYGLQVARFLCQFRRTCNEQPKDCVLNFRVPNSDTELQFQKLSAFHCAVMRWAACALPVVVSLPFFSPLFGAMFSRIHITGIFTSWFRLITSDCCETQLCE